MARAFSLFAAIVSFSAAVCAVLIHNERRQLSVGDITKVLNLGFITHINGMFTLDTLINNRLTVNFDVENALPIELTFKTIFCSAGLNSTEYGTFNITFPSPGLVVPPSSTVNSGAVTMLLVQDLASFLDIVAVGVLDLEVDADLQAQTVQGQDGFFVPLDRVQEESVPANYSIVFG